MAIFNSQKRFIAGAQCPQCGARDTLRVFSSDGFDFRDCVRCGFVENMNAASPNADLPARPELDKPESEPEQVVQLLVMPPIR